MTPHKLPSGRWNVRIMIDGRSHSITADTKTECRNQAAALIEANKRQKVEGITVLEAMSNYVDAKRNVLSVTTVAQYERFRDNAFPSLWTIPVGRLTSLDVQQAVNEESGRKKERGGKPVSAKTVKNEYEFLRAAVALARPDLAIHVTLPKPVKTFRDLPTPQQVIKNVKGSDIELPALLAMWLSLTASEIRGIKVSSIKDGILTIDESVVQVNGEAIHKPAAKAYDRNRRIRVPDYIMGLIKKTDAWKKGVGYIETRSGKALSSRFSRVMKGTMRFHDLRHLFASVGLALNVPEKYLMEQGGWSTPSTMKTVYQHTFEKERIDHQGTIDNYFSKLVSNSCQVDMQNISENGN